MAQKSLTFVSSLIAAIAVGLLAERSSNLNAVAHTVVSQSSPSPARTVPNTTNQKNYPVVEEDDWLNPFAKLPLNQPTLIGKKGSKQDLAELSVDILNPPRTPPTIIITKNSPRQYRLVTQWKQNELRVYAYEILKTCEADSCSEKVDPSPVNQGLFRINQWDRTCSVPRSSGPRPTSPSLVYGQQVGCSRPLMTPILTPEDGENLARRWAGLPVILKLPSLVMAPDGTTRTDIQLVIYVDNKPFILGSADGTDGERGVFPINAALAKALEETTSPVRVLIPSNWEAVINRDAIKSLNVLYQKSGMSQKQR